MNWPELIEPLHEECGTAAGIYCCWAGDKVLYIGTANVMYTRLCNHERKADLIAHGIDRITWIEVSRATPYRIEMEAWLIRKHRPLLNNQHARKPLPIPTELDSADESINDIREYLRNCSRKAAKARREKITPERRSEIASTASAARWTKLAKTQANPS